MQQLHLTIDDRPVLCSVPPHATLYDLLCQLNVLDGEYAVCEAGDCCQCTVLLAGAAICACQVLAWEAEDLAVQTIHSLADHPLVERLRSLNGPCGDCLNAYALAGVAYLQAHPTAGPDALRRLLLPIPCNCGLGHYVLRFLQDSGAAAGPGCA